MATRARTGKSLNTIWGVRVSIRPEQPEPFLRGCVFPAVTDTPYPRADPANAEYLPADVWDAAQLPVGVRLELEGGAKTIRVWYKTTRASLGYRGESAGCTFVAYRAGQKVAVQEAVMGEGMVELVITGRPDLPVTVYLPEGMRPLITGVAGVEETMTPAPLQPRWLAYGDAVTQGWLASAPAMAWPAVTGRKLGLDVCNLGYAGTARGETTSALMLAETPAEVISIAFGLNNWSRVPHTAALMAEEVRCFLSVVREGHPDIPIVVVSPTARPDAEDTPNRVGATLADLRTAMERTVLEGIASGDGKLYLVEGLSVVGPEDLEDGMYPGDEGHRRLAAAVGKVLVPHLEDLQMAAAKRWATEGIPTTSAFASSGFVSSAFDGDAVDDESSSAGPRSGAADGGLLDGEFVDGEYLDGGFVEGAPVDVSVDSESAHGESVEGEFLEGGFVGDPAAAAAEDSTTAAAAVTAAADAEDAENSTGHLDTPAGHIDAPASEALERGSLSGELLDALSPDVTSLNGASDHADLLNEVPAADTDFAPVDTDSVGFESPAEAALVDATAQHTEYSETEAPVIAEADGGEADAAVQPQVGPEATPVSAPVDTPVDLEIADMVVAALTLASNGADEVIDEPDPAPMAELEWVDTGGRAALQWEEPVATHDGANGTIQSPARDSQWVEAGPEAELQWVEPGPNDGELEWAEPTPDGELQWSAAAEPGPL